jgi:hypothetical protein
VVELGSVSTYNEIDPVTSGVHGSWGYCAVAADLLECGLTGEGFYKGSVFLAVRE